MVSFAKARAAGVPIWHGTLAAGDMLYLPPGVMRVEKVMGDDVIGIRMSLIHTKEPNAIEELHLANAELLTMGRQNMLVNGLLGLKESAASKRRPHEGEWSAEGSPFEQDGSATRAAETHGGARPEAEQQRKPGCAAGGWSRAYQLMHTCGRRR